MILKAVLVAALLFVAAAILGNNLRRDDESLGMAVVYGFIIQWAVAFFAAVPMIILKRPLSHVVSIVAPAYGVLLVTGLVRLIIRLRAQKVKPERVALTRSEIVYLGLFIGIVIFELYKTLFYAYADGDDSFYIATARIAETSDTMYTLDAYVGIANIIPFRYALAPFPMWIAALARMSGVDSTTLSFSVLSPMLILVTYFLYNEISKLLFGRENREKRYMFLVLVAVFDMFANVSTSTAGTFMLTRARQGKEALACIILPLVFYELFRIVKADGKVKLLDFAVLFTIASAAALTSLLGNVLVPIMLAGAGMWMIVKRKGFVNIILLALSVVVNLMTVLLYMKIN